MLTYFEFGELKPGDLFRFAGYDDLYLKLDNVRAICQGCINPKGKRLARKNERVEIAPNVGGLILI